jgi:hypothetical protein
LDRVAVDLVKQLLTHTDALLTLSVCKLLVCQQRNPPEQQRPYQQQCRKYEHLKHLRIVLLQAKDVDTRQLPAK